MAMSYQGVRMALLASLIAKTVARGAGGIALDLVGGLTGILRMLAGGAIIGGAMWFYMNAFALPAAEQTGFDRCKAQWERQAAIERSHQIAANNAAQRAEQARTAQTLQRNAGIQRQLQEMANAITSGDWSDAVCLGPDRVPALNAIR